MLAVMNLSKQQRYFTRKAQRKTPCLTQLLLLLQRNSTPMQFSASMSGMQNKGLPLLRTCCQKKNEQPKPYPTVPHVVFHQLCDPYRTTTSLANQKSHSW